MTEKQNIQREPLVRLAKRDDLSGAKKWAIRLVAIVLALVVGSLFIAVLGHNPIAVYHDIITGSLGGPSTAKVTVRVAIPLLGAAQDGLVHHIAHGQIKEGHNIDPIHRYAFPRSDEP